MPGKKILLVDDEPKIVEIVRLYLEKDGYRVVTAGDGEKALDANRREKPDLIILDLNLPEVDGLEVCKTIRRGSNVPIIMLTARDEGVDKLIGLELGADDYITKPFSPREVVARVKAVLRRVGGEASLPEILRVGDLSIDLGRHEVRRGDTAIDLTPTEFKLLEVMAQNPGRVYTRLQLLDKVQGYTFEGYERTVDAHIKNLRQKVEPDPQKPKYVVTVYGVGYRFEEPSNA
ncbi:MAG: response regulator transcription factor [Dehalococcoidia bacterium]|nr:response regulator transcription factor [Dehalococcoidia bacterium]